MNTINGLHNLAYTYNKDTVIQSQIDLLIDKIKIRINKINKILKIVTIKKKED